MLLREEINIFFIGKPYFWCTCGKGHKQPFCDGTHKNPELKITLKYVLINYYIKHS